MILVIVVDAIVSSQEPRLHGGGDADRPPPVARIRGGCSHFQDRHSALPLVRPTLGRLARGPRLPQVLLRARPRTKACRQSPLEPHVHQGPQQWQQHEQHLRVTRDAEGDGLVPRPVRGRRARTPELMTTVFSTCLVFLVDETCIHDCIWIVAYFHRVFLSLRDCERFPWIRFQFPSVPGVVFVLVLFSDCFLWKFLSIIYSLHIIARRCARILLMKWISQETETRGARSIFETGEAGFSRSYF